MTQHLSSSPTSQSVAVLMGGTSSERSVSLSSGKAVTAALKEAGHHVHALDVGPDITTTIAALKACRPTVVFNALHGPGGEDGAIQGVLEWLGLPYTHSGILASAIAMNKATTRMALQAAGLPVAEGCLITPAALIDRAPLPAPYVLKPVAEGSSVGVHILHQDDKSTRRTIAESWTYGPQILAEHFIPGRELTVAVLGDTPLAVTEILPQEGGGFYDFAAKYQANGSRHIIPAPLPTSITERALALACQAHHALGCKGASRTDYRYDEQTHQLVILEVNTQPGMTATSLLPEQAAARGVNYPQLCDWLIKDALGQASPLTLTSLPSTHTA
ncbi:D-alanine--D-alanine ligase [Bombella saccharophila]|uniref:D-alanine--D-alanine ligase n=1 Tax=Bombella saccharophila TaxID=2967338 RepID=A0ABT3W6F2_9PROT|nr:D-alanine--D-alanine ligase [Bombella saccharophila]MCX5614363.1 D-alanine--D-alanine ligase [Bombella saccharophila]